MVASILLMIIYVGCSALGLTLLKMGLNDGVKLTFSTACMEMKLPMLLFAGILLYICSFLLNMLVMSRFNLSYVYPVSAALIYIAIVVFSVILLKEQVSRTQMIGMAVILVGIVIMNLKK